MALTVQWGPVRRAAAANEVASVHGPDQRQHPDLRGALGLSWDWATEPSAVVAGSEPAAERSAVTGKSGATSS